jgi:protein-disulfide isomerase/uncharacterized membrane protein
MKLKIALLLSLVAIGLHIYLAFHFYGLHYGMSTGESVCNLSSQFNCDTVSASRYSSVAGVPIALFGAMANIVIALMLAAWILGWADNLSRHAKLTFLLSALIAATSVVMGSISTFFISSYCIFCIGTYILSFFVFGLVAKSQVDTENSIIDQLPALFADAKSYLILFAAIPAGAFFMHKVYLQQVGADRLDLIVRNSLYDWQAAPLVTIESKALMAKGPENAKMVIKEYADFRCGHCKYTSPSLKAFSNSHPDVRFEFYAFPLDGTCNEAMDGGGDGISCYLAKSVHCAEKLSNGGWAMHDHIFESQEKINNNPTLQNAGDIVAQALPLLSISADAHKACVEDAETIDLIKRQAKSGADAGVKGTPSFYVNSRKLSRGNMIPVLEKVYESVNR